MKIAGTTQRFSGSLVAKCLKELSFLKKCVRFDKYAKFTDLFGDDKWL